MSTVTLSGAGPWPGDGVLEAQTTVVGDLAEAPDGVAGLPFSVTLPARAPWADATGRGVALLADLPAELGPHGWRLTDRPGADVQRARSALREDLDAVAVAAHGYAGPWLVPVLGPVSLAARLYLARGDRVLGDAGGLRELTASLAAGLVEHLADLRRAVPGIEPTVLLHEPTLAAAVAGVLPSFSGYARLRRVAAPVAGELLAGVVDALRAAGARHVAVHAGTSWSAIGPVRLSGADGVGLVVAGLDDRAWELVAEAVEAGVRLWAQLPVQASSSCAGPDVTGQARTLLDPWRRVGLGRDRLRDVVLLDAGRPDGTPDDARGALAGLARAALVVAEHADS